MFDIAFSNYVFHWIKDPVSAIKEVYNNLAHGGRFAFCCVCGMPQVIVDLCESVGEDGKKITDSLYFNTKQDWISYFERAGFTIMITNEVPDYHFQNIDDVMTWWEATTHGLFSINKLSTVRLEHIRKKYPAEINIYRKETLRLLAKK